MKKVLALLLVAVLGFALASCVEGEPQEGSKVQGITETEIIVGNTAATTGVFAGVGVPFNLAMQVVFDEYNATREEGERKIKLIHYDDEFDGSKGLTYTKKLVEEDKVFALVGHFGTNTVEATIDYLLEKEVPMVYGVTGVNSLYFEPADGGKNILSVQPIYRSEGEVLLARVLHEKLFGENGDAKLAADKKIVVLYSDDDAGQSIKVGVEDGAKAEEVTARVVYLPFNVTTADAVVTTALAQDPGAIILASNQAPATAAATALREKDSNVPVFSSYVNSQAVFAPAQVEGAPLPYQVYANAWVDIVDPLAPAPTVEQVGGDGTLVGFNFDLAFLPGFTAEYWEFVKLMNDSTRVDGDTPAKALWADPYAMAGYVAAKTFVMILEKVEDFDTLTWDSFITLAESQPWELPLAGTIDWKDGYRVGLNALALNVLTYPEGQAIKFEKVREIELLEEVRAK